jgi:hypothetical protein
VRNDGDDAALREKHGAAWIDRTMTADGRSADADGMAPERAPNRFGT